GETAIGALVKLGTPLTTQVAPIAYGEMLGQFDAWAVRGPSRAIRTRTVAGYTPGVIDALVEAGGH
ncbi:MAG TPA: FAD-binding oxidoreductase, partial [Mycobacterium sp.]|nr:FAD-binding oxidoreductase [Mycobacterium sp.]